MLLRINNMGDSNGCDRYKMYICRLKQGVPNVITFNLKEIISRHSDMFDIITNCYLNKVFQYNEMAFQLLFVLTLFVWLFLFCLENIYKFTLYVSYKVFSASSYEAL